MPVTDNDSIYFTDGNTTESSENESAVQASSVQTAFDKRQIRGFRYSTVDAQEADKPGKVAGDMAYNVQTKANYRFDGTSWRFFGDSDWVSWTPTLTNVNLGTGYTSIFKYRYVGDSVQVKLRLAIGTGGSVGTGPSFTLPVPAAPAIGAFQAFNGIGTIYIGTSIYPTVAIQVSTTKGTFYGWALSGGGYQTVTSGYPGDMGSAPTGFVIDFSYEPA